MTWRRKPQLTRTLVTALLMVWLSGCASGHCFKNENRGIMMEDSQFVQSLGISEKTVLVQKADGSLQCGEEGIARNGHSAEEMRKELEGVPIFNQRKTNDGLLRIAQCGAPTGFINVYEIPEKYLSEALRRGFTQAEARDPGQ